MDIEEVAAKTPEKILKAHVHPATGFQPFVGRKLAFGMNLAPEQIRPATQLIGNLYRAFADSDASLVEINPLVVTSDGRLLALDAKFNLDDNALFRHREYPELRDPGQEDELVPPAQALRFYGRLGGSKRFLELPGARHDLLLDDPTRVVRELRDWFSGTLSGRT